jgi:hypothetical protein
MTKSIQTLVFSPQGVAPCWVVLREIGSPKAVTDAEEQPQKPSRRTRVRRYLPDEASNRLLTARTVVSIKTRDDVPQVQPRDPN